jgi:hypothetical protein
MIEGHPVCEIRSAIALGGKRIADPSRLVCTDGRAIALGGQISNRIPVFVRRADLNAVAPAASRLLGHEAGARRSLLEGLATGVRDGSGAFAAGIVVAKLALAVVGHPVEDVEVAIHHSPATGRPLTEVVRSTRGGARGVPRRGE